jgi:hypothetical protein
MTTTTKKGQGVATFKAGTGTAAASLSRPPGAGAMAGGQPDPPRGRGLAVRLSRVAGLTKPGLLESPFHFQIAPLDAFRRSGTAEWSDFQTLGGPASRPGQQALEEFAFRSMFVDYDPEWAAYHFGTSMFRQLPTLLPPAAPVDPLGWLADLREIRDALTPVALLVGEPRVWGAWHVKNAAVTLRGLAEEYSEADSVNIDLTFTEYRQTRLGTKTMTKYPATVAVDDTGKAKWTDGTGAHSINNATLQKLAQTFYGSPSKWKTITRHQRNRNLKTYSPGRELDDYARQHGKKSGSRKVANVYVPVPED